MKRVPHNLSLHPPKAASGSALAIIVVLLAALIGFLGVAIYTGLNAYLQNELQNAVSTAAGAAATSFYDDFDPATGQPRLSAAKAKEAAETTFANIVSSNPAMQNFGARLTKPPDINPGLQTVTVEARASVPTPFLAPVGINRYNVDAVAQARYAHMEIPGSNFSIDTTNGPFFRMMLMDPPIIDGPGPDLRVGSLATGGGYHGIIVEVCSDGKCYDVGAASRLAGDGIVAERSYPGYGRRMVLYGGPFYIDFGGTNTGGVPYNRNVKKGVALRIIDDGVHDYIVPGSLERGVEMDPAATQVMDVHTYHQAIFCANAAVCSLPRGFGWGVGGGGGT